MNWISVKERMPEVETEVLVSVKNQSGIYVITSAIYEDGKMPEILSSWMWDTYCLDYDEATDEYLVPEGWWEYRHYNGDDTYNNVIDGNVTHWMPLPEPPKEEIKL